MEMQSIPPYGISPFDPDDEPQVFGVSVVNREICFPQNKGRLERPRSTLIGSLKELNNQDILVYMDDEPNVQALLQGKGQLMRRWIVGTRSVRNGSKREKKEEEPWLSDTQSEDS